MEMHLPYLTFVLVFILALGVAAQWVAWWMRMPAIVLFLVFGVLAGPVLGIVNPTEEVGPVLQPIISLAVALILFEGGMTLRWHEFKEAAAGVRRLVTLGAALSWIGYASAAYFVGDLSLPVSLLFGAILVVTGPTVIMPMLRQARLNRRTASYLKWEGIINDPVGALLAVLVFQFFIITSAVDVVGPDSLAMVFVELGLAIFSSVLLGGGIGWLLGWAFNHVWVPEYLKAPMTVASVLTVFAAVSAIFEQGGLLAVTIMGMVMGNMTIAGIDELRRFKEYVTILLVSTVFVVMTADMNPQVLEHLGWHSAALVGMAIFVVRPAVVYLSTLSADMDWRDRLLVSWIAPRGIVAAAMAGVFGPTLAEAGFEGGNQLLPLIFAMVFATCILHGFSITWLARKLRLSANANGILIVGASPWATALARALTNELHMDVLLVDSSWHRLRSARLAGVRVIYGEVLSTRMQQSLELNEIACVLAATSNDAYNSLVCSHFSKHLEHDRVFQLSMKEAEEKSTSKVVASPLRGLYAFSEAVQYEDLWRCHFQGWQFYKTRLTQAYGYNALKAAMPEGAILIAILRGQKNLLLYSANSSAVPGVGDTVVYYAPKTHREERRRARPRRNSRGQDGESAGHHAMVESTDTTQTHHDT